MAKPERSPAMLWYVNDHLSSGKVNSLSPAEECWYRRSLDHAWMNDGMPADPDEFAGWVGRGCTIEAAQKIINKFYIAHKKDPSRVLNERQEKERRKLKEKTAKRIEAGRLSGVSRRKKRDLDIEQCSNKPRTKTNISSSISIPISNSIDPDPTDQDQSDLDRWLSPCLKAFAEIDPRIVEIGILYTLLQRTETEPIRSAKYFGPEINRTLAAGLSSQTIDAMLEQRRNQYQEQSQ